MTVVSQVLFVVLNSYKDRCECDSIWEDISTNLKLN